MKHERFVWLGIIVALALGAGWFKLRERSAVRAQIDAALRADSVTRDLDDATRDLSAVLVNHAALKHVTDSTKAELAKAKAQTQRTSASLARFRDSVGAIPAPTTASDSVVQLLEHVSLLNADRHSKDAALARADSTIAALTRESAGFRAGVDSALARLTHATTAHAAYRKQTKDWGPPPSRHEDRPGSRVYRCWVPPQCIHVALMPMLRTEARVSLLGFMRSPFGVTS